VTRDDYIDFRTRVVTRIGEVKALLKKRKRPTKKLCNEMHRLEGDLANLNCFANLALMSGAMEGVALQ